MNWRPLHKGSKNPPAGEQVVLKARDGSVGLGICHQDGLKKRVFFDFIAMRPVRAWYGEGKESFTDWARIESI
jgi:hypothetical protein